MKQTELANTGIKVSGLSLGTWAYSGAKIWGKSDDDAAKATVHYALDHGMNLIDTAEKYGDGRSEEVVGCFIDGTPAIIIFSPVAVAIAEALGINPIQLGIVCCMTCSFGLITPPFGLCLLMAGKIANVSIIPTIKAIIPFILLFVITIWLVIFIPPLATWLPSLLG